MIRRMQRRLTAVLLLFLVGIYAGFCAVSYFASAGSTARDSAMMLDRIDAPAPPGEGMPHMPGQVGVPYFTIHLDQSGTVVDTRQGQFDLTEEDLEKIAALAMEDDEERGYLEAYKLRYFRTNEPSGWRLVLVDDSIREEMVRKQITSSIFVGLLLLPVFFLFSKSVSAFIVRPVRRAWDQQTQFVADASHELKTPLTVILSNTDMILSDCHEDDNDLRRRADYIREEASRMRGLVMDLLSLTRNDAAPAKRGDLTAIDLSSVTETAALSFEAVAYEKGLNLSTQLKESILVPGVEKEAAQLLSILLDNAVKYSLPRGTIAVTLAVERGKHALLTVSNPSEKLGTEQLQRLFDRFYRADEARSLQPGYGLGLSMAQGIVSHWSGKIWAEHREGETRFCVRLPLHKGE